MAEALRHYKQVDENLKDCEATAQFCERINSMFDALNRVSPDKGLTFGCEDLQVCI